MPDTGFIQYSNHFYVLSLHLTLYKNLVYANPAYEKPVYANPVSYHKNYLKYSVFANPVCPFHDTFVHPSA